MSRLAKSIGIPSILIIIAYEFRARAAVMRDGHQARVVVADEQNHCLEFMEQNLIPQGDRLDFQSSSY